MPRQADMYKNGFRFYGVLYASKADCIEQLGIRDYAQLDSYIARERRGLPFIPLSERRLTPQSFGGSRRKYFTEVLEKHGFWRKK